MSGSQARRTFVVEADGGSRGNPGPAGYGAVVRDAASGETLRETAEFIGQATNNVAEYRGLLAGLRAAYELDAHAAVLVRMDSKLVVEQMSGRWKIKHPDMRPLALEAAAVFPPDAVTYEWIPREQNKHADRLANEAMDAGKRGERWDAGASRAELDAHAASAAAGPAAAESAAAEPAAATEPGPTAPGTRVGWGPDLGTPTTFVLLRHGETPLTPEKRFSGSGGSDPELSAVGRRQAAAVAEALAARGTVQAVVSSPLRRCQETAATVAGRLGLGVHTDAGLRETDFGAWEGLTFAEVRERHPEDLDAWLASPSVRPTGGGESFAEVAERVAGARDELLARYEGRTVLLVTHVTPVKTLVRLALGAPPESLYRMELSAASLSAVAYYADGNASLRLLNDTGHLR
ncbi:bifunctional RNase H/acid phosphatase [Streptomyces sp. 891-h]|uniref:bifunctional RNase H/acid phosphatase n=1 Tax=Streptomyces sp. 891-h TaxID=2720714 RepID=UPI001FAA8F6C|nr:bifunctional RNase H/acid phosphatase [Streptomyces sp. 891-h]UNZ19533.1 bifunctional RNase H/acid phosphatase [Streptomyces sp. 891-h]